MIKGFKSVGRLCFGLGAVGILASRLMPPEGNVGLGRYVLTAVAFLLVGIFFISGAVTLPALKNWKNRMARIFMGLMGVFFLVLAVMSGKDVIGDIQAGPKTADFRNCYVYYKTTSKGLGSHYVLNGSREDGRTMSFRITGKTAKSLDGKDQFDAVLSYYENTSCLDEIVEVR